MRKLHCFSIIGLTMAAAAVHASGVLADNYNFDKTFTDDASLQQTRMTVMWDGVNYWSSSGGGTGGNRLSQYDAAGNLLNTYQPGIDFRSVFGNGSGNVFARGFNDPNIYRQTAPGTFVVHVTLSGGTLDAQSAVVQGGNEYLAMEGGLLERWDLSGNYLGNVNFSGWGTMNGEGGYPQNRNLAYWSGYYLTYSQGVMSAWDAAGNRVGQGNLVGAGTSFDSYFSFGYADDGRAWVVDQAGETWRGFTLAPVPEPATMAVLGIGALALLRRRRK